MSYPARAEGLVNMNLVNNSKYPCLSSLIKYAYKRMCWQDTHYTVGLKKLLLCDSRNSERYLSRLQDDVWPVVNTCENIENLIFMQDGVSPHLPIAVREKLNGHLPGRWMICHGPTLEQLKELIREAMSSIPPEFQVSRLMRFPGVLRSW